MELVQTTFESPYENLECNSLKFRNEFSGSLDISRHLTKLPLPQVFKEQYIIFTVTDIYHQIFVSDI